MSNRGHRTILQKKRLTLGEANGELVIRVQSEASSQEAGLMKVSIQARRLLWYCLSKDYPRIAPHFLIGYLKCLWDQGCQQSERLHSPTTNPSLSELLAVWVNTSYSDHLTINCSKMLFYEYTVSNNK